MSTQNYQPKKAVATLSNAMDVGNPSNFVRILELFDNEFLSLKEKLSSISISDEETKSTIRSVKQSCNYLLDPHGAVGYLALEKYLNKHADQKGFFVETAHPVKFYDVVEPVIKEKIPLPEVVSAILDKEKVSTRINADYNLLKDFLLQ
jgi:threonine synthase